MKHKKLNFINLFKLDRSFFQVLLWDTLFLVFILSILALFTLIAKFHMPLLHNMLNLMGGGLSNSNIPVVYNGLNLFFIRSIFIVIIFLFILFSVGSLIKSISWCIILKKKLNKRLYKNFLFLIMSWILIWLLLFLLITYGIRSSLNVKIAIIELFLFYYFTIILLPISFKIKNILTTIKKVFVFGIFEFYRLLLPFCLVVGGIFIFTLFFMHFLISSLSIHLIITFSLFYLYLVWTKFFIFSLIERISKNVK